VRVITAERGAGPVPQHVRFGTALDALRDNPLPDPWWSRPL